MIAAGSDNGIGQDTPIVTSDGLVGASPRSRASAAQVTLLTDESSAVPARDQKSGAIGLVRHGQGEGSLILDLVIKDGASTWATTIVTAGTRSKQYPSLFPRGIPIGVVTHVGQSDTAPYKQIQIDPFVDFSSLDAVTALITRSERRPADARGRRKAAGLLFFVVVVQLSIMANVDDPRRPSEPPARDARLRRASARRDLRRRRRILRRSARSTRACSARSASPRCCSRSPATGRAATGRRPDATARTRRCSRSRSSRCSTRSPRSCFASCSASRRRRATSSAALVPTVLLNLILTVPVYALTRRLLRPREWVAREVRLLG